MDLKSLLSKGGRRERAVQRAARKAGNAKIKPDDRRPALYVLVDDGGALAIEGLLSRLTFNYDTNIIADEEEKTFVYEGLVSMGERVVPALRKYLSQAPTLSWGLRILREICPPERAWDVLTDILSKYEPGYERDPSRKQQLLTFLGDLQVDGVSSAILPFLDDHDETVRFLTIEALFKHGDEAVAREPLLKLLTDEDEESLRLKNRIADGFCDNGWGVKGYRGSVEKALSGEYVVDGKGRIKRKKGRT